MKVPVVLTAFVVAASTASAYVCPSPADVAYSCKQLNVFPLVCYNPNMNKEACNAKQCNQKYIDDYAACQCRRTTSNFYEHSRNIKGLIKRCGGGLNNPYGGPTSSTPASRIPTSVATVITRTHTTNLAVTTAVGTTTAQPIVAPTEIAISTQSSKMSGGAIAGTVLGILGALGLAGLLGWCWRRSRAAHVPIVSSTTRVGRGAPRTIVTEKIEPLVVKSANADQTYHAASVPVAATAAGVGAAAGAAGGSAYASRSQPAGSSTSYTTSSGVPAAGAGTTGTSGTAGGAAYGSRSQPTSSNYTTTTSDVPAVTASHVQPGTTHSTTTGQPGSTSTYTTPSSGLTTGHTQSGSTTYTTSGGNVHQPTGTTNSSMSNTTGSNGPSTTQPGSTTNTTYNTTTTSSGGNTTGQSGDKTIYSSSNGYNPKSHN